MSLVKTAVFPVAGLGTRFLPATKSVAKEMLTVVDKPLIQYGAEEAIAAGANKLVFIVGRTKNSIIDHFDKAYELETELAARGKDELLQIVRDVVPDGVACIFIRQSEALGLGHAVLCAEPAVGYHPFSVILPDDLIINEGGKGCVQQMVEIYEKYDGSVVGTQTVDVQQSRKYGMIAGSEVEEGLLLMDDIVEKPAPEEAPSDQGVVGRYVLSPAIFDVLRTTGQGAGGEIQLTDAIAELRKTEEVYGYSFAGRRYDCGSKEGYLQATVELAMNHKDLGAPFKKYLKSLDLD